VWVLHRSLVTPKWVLSEYNEDLIFDFLWFFKLIMTKWNWKKSVMSSFQWRYRYYVIEKRHQIIVQNFSIWDPLPQSKFLARPIMTLDPIPHSPIRRFRIGPAPFYDIIWWYLNSLSLLHLQHRFLHTRKLWQRIKKL